MCYDCNIQIALASAYRSASPHARSLEVRGRSADVGFRDTVSVLWSSLLFSARKQRARAYAISAEIRGRCTTSEMPAASNVSAPLSSAEAVASRIGISGTISCSADSQIKCRRGRREMAHHRRIEPVRRRPAGRHRITDAREADWLIRRARQAFPRRREASRRHRRAPARSGPARTGETPSLHAAPAQPAAMQGSQTSKRLPTPGALQTFIAPPCSRTISRTVASPKPLPARRVVKNGSKMRSTVDLVHAAPGVTHRNTHIAAQA